MTEEPKTIEDAESAADAESPAAESPGHPLSFERILARVQERFADCQVEDLGEKAGGEPHLLAPLEKVWEVCDLLRNDDELHFDSLMSQAGVDDGEQLAIVYCLHSLPRDSGGESRGGHRLLLKTVLPRGNPPEDCPHAPSVESLWKVANYFEREIYDLFGILFDNHPDLIRIMNPEDWVGHPGRKDYVYPAYYGVDEEGQAIPTEREGQFIDNQTLEEKIEGLPLTKDAKDGPVREWDQIREGDLTKAEAAQRAGMGEIRVYSGERRGPHPDEPSQLGEGITKPVEPKKPRAGKK